MRDETLKNDEAQRASGLFLGSEPVGGVQDRRASGKADDDSKDRDKGDDDSTDSDKSDTDTVDKGDGVDKTRDADGRD